MDPAENALCLHVVSNWRMAANLPSAVALCWVGTVCPTDAICVLGCLVVHKWDSEAYVTARRLSHKLKQRVGNPASPKRPPRFPGGDRTQGSNQQGLSQATLSSWSTSASAT
jgi:hypothetical protein